MDEKDVRARVRYLIERDGTYMKTVSLGIGQNETYVQQYLTKEKPFTLPEDVRLAMARYFRVNPRELGATLWQRSYFDLLDFPIRCEAPECGADFRIAIRGLVSRDTINCPTCSSVVDLKKLKPFIDDIVRVAAALDKESE